VEHDPDVEVAITVEGVVKAGGRTQYSVQPALTAATTLHTGSYESLSLAYSALMYWIEANDYQIALPNREIYLRGPGQQHTPEQYITEIQFPIQKR
jgi:effector-binding domain-containing protein